MKATVETITRNSARLLVDGKRLWLPLACLARDTAEGDEVELVAFHRERHPALTEALRQEVEE